MSFRPSLSISTTTPPTQIPLRSMVPHFENLHPTPFLCVFSLVLFNHYTAISHSKTSKEQLKLFFTFCLSPAVCWEKTGEAENLRSPQWNTSLSLDLTGADDPSHRLNTKWTTDICQYRILKQLPPSHILNVEEGVTYLNKIVL